MNTTDVKKFKILHFEDDEFLAELFKVVFEREGLEYINYDNPTKDPASIVVKEKPDIVIMDFMMPGMDGFAATEILKKDSRTKNIPIFFLGNLSQKEEVERGISLGATDYLICSQLTPSETMRLIKKYLEDPSHYQPWYLNWLNKKESQKNEPSKIEKELEKEDPIDYQPRHLTEIMAMTLGLERGPEGRLLPTLRNKDIIGKIFEECGRDGKKLSKTIGRELFAQYSFFSLNDPRNPNIYFLTKEAAIQASQRADLLNSLDKKYLADKIKIIKSDITKVKTEAIVNSAAKELLGGGGVDGDIHDAAGPKLFAECLKLGGCETGQAKLTRGYNLPAKYIIHTVGPVWVDGEKNERYNLACCYRNCLKVAVENNIKSIAFPSISTGLFRFPIKKAVPIVFGEVIKFLETNNKIEEVIFVLYSDKDFKTYQNFYNKVFKK